MAKRMNADDQFKFLLTCVKWSNNGKVDFAAVARECGVVSKAAAAKRYERMLKAHGIHPHGGPLESPATSIERVAYGTTSFKKRKLDETAPLVYHSDIEDQKSRMPHVPSRTPDPNIKQEPPLMGCQSYMYHPMMSYQSPFMQRPMPHVMPQVMAPMPRLPNPPPPYQMVPGMSHSNSSMTPPHQMNACPMNQALPPLSHDRGQTTFNSFDDICNTDFTKCERFEELMNGALDPANDICDIPKIQGLISEPEQTGAALQLEASAPVHAEQNQLTQIIKSEAEQNKDRPALTEVSATVTPSSPSTVNTSATAVTLPAAALGKTLENLKPVKQEREDCFVVLSP